MHTATNIRMHPLLFIAAGMLQAVMPGLQAGAFSRIGMARGSFRHLHELISAAALS